MLLKTCIFIKKPLFSRLFARVLLNSRNSLLLLAAPCVGCFLICFHKSSHHLLIPKSPLVGVSQSQRLCVTQQSFLRICRATTFRNNFTWLLLYVYLSHIIKKRKTAAQQTIACLRSTIQNLDKL